MRPAFKTASESFPKSGNRELPVILNFTAVSVINDDLSPEMRQSQIETIQSIYIDNSLNSGTFTIQFFPSQQIISVQPFTQGVYPVICWGAISYTAQTNGGVKVPVIFSNTARNWQTWGPTPGITVVPPLTNIALDLEPTLNGDNVLVVAVANQSVKLYRGIFNVGAASVLKFYDGPSAGNKLLFAATLFAGGSLTFEPSGIPWMTTSVGNALILNMSNVNIYGGYGYVQS